jgi:hypothetical protein
MQCHLLYTHQERSIQRFTPHVERSPGEHPLPDFPRRSGPLRPLRLLSVVRALQRRDDAEVADALESRTACHR